MQRFMLKSKIHRATVTDADLHYEGSISIDEKLLEEAGIAPYEQVAIYDVDNGERFTTYAIKGKRDSGTICLNGAAARLGHVGDKIIIMAYCRMEDDEARRHQPIKILVDDQNHIVTAG